MISFKDVAFTYKGKKDTQLKVPSFFAADGECILLTGMSGSGKSTITKCINGLIPEFFEGEFSGDIFIKELNIGNLPVYEISQYVGSVFQDPASQFFTGEVLTELAFACENYGVERAEIKTRMEYAVQIIGIERLITKKLKDMSNGEKQKIAVASALTLMPSIILFDEPSSNLDYASIKILGNVIRSLKEKGLTVIIAEHRIYYLKELFDRVLYINGGKIEKEYTAEQFRALTNEELHGLGLRSLNIFEDKPVRRFRNAEEFAEKGETCVIALKDISFSYKDSGKKILNNIGFSLYKGDITALVGKNGIGKTTLLRIISGIYKEDSGGIVMGKKELPAFARVKNINFVMNDVDYQLFGDTVYNELLIGAAESPFLHKKIEEVLKRLNLYDLKDMHPMSLSMGQKQRLIIAASYIRNSAVTVLDEPTSGLDYKNMLNVSAMLSDLASEDNTVLIVSHDYEFIMNTCDRLLFLDETGIASDIRTSENGDAVKHIFEHFIGGIING